MNFYFFLKKIPVLIVFFLFSTIKSYPSISSRINSRIKRCFVNNEEVEVFYQSNSLCFVKRKKIKLTTNFSCVCNAECNIDGKYLNAVEKQYLRHMNQRFSDYSKLAIKEANLQMLLSMGHHAIISPLSFYRGNYDEFFLLMENLGESLEDVLEKNLKSLMSRDFIIEAGIQISSALIFMHDINLSHNDIKLGNVIYNEEKNKFYLIDFGMTSLFGSDSFCKKGTPFYVSSDAVCSDRINRYRDVFALGVSLYKLRYGHYPQVKMSRMKFFHSAQIEIYQTSKYTEDYKKFYLRNEKYIKRDPLDRLIFKMISPLEKDRLYIHEVYETLKKIQLEFSEPSDLLPGVCNHDI